MARKRASDVPRPNAGPSTVDPPFAVPDWPKGWTMWKLDRITPYPKNARTHPPDQIALLANMLKRWGPDQPIVVDEDGVILKGHGRLLAAIEAGLEEFPVVERRGLPAAEKSAIRIADNQVALLAGWDSVLIGGELSELEMTGFDLPFLGFPETQLIGWGLQSGTEGLQDPEIAPELPKDVFVRGGDLWMLGDHRLLCGDATNAKDVERLLGKDQPHFMVTDPPYGVNYNPNWRNEKLSAYAIGRVQNDDRWDWREAWNLFPGDIIYCWSGCKFLIESGIALQQSGFNLRVEIIWAKLHHPIGRGDYHVRHKSCWYAVRDGKPAHWNGARNQNTLWEIGHSKSETGHGTQKPIECMKRPMENNSQPRDFVYDPFVGSGTTIIAAEMTARKALAIEIDPGYCQVSIERWQSFTGKQATLDGKAFAEVQRERQKKKAGRPASVEVTGKIQAAK